MKMKLLDGCVEVTFDEVVGIKVDTWEGSNTKVKLTLKNNDFEKLVFMAGVLDPNQENDQSKYTRMTLEP